MSGENTLKACARELLIAIFRAEGAEGSARQVEIDPAAHAPALEILEAALTRSPVCEDAGEVVEALKKLLAANSVLTAESADFDAMLKIAEAERECRAALAKASEHKP